MKKICAITMARNDAFFLSRWIDYYGTQLGNENLYIFLDGRDQKIPENGGGANIKIVEHVEGKLVQSDKGRSSILSKAARELFENYDLVIGADVDEFLIVDPLCKKSLAEYLNEISIKTSVSGLGLDVGQKIGSEVSINPELPFLSQRSFALISSRYTKTSVISQPLSWGAGFHRIRKHNFNIDPNLYLFHFGSADVEIVKSKMNDTEKIKQGWERHLSKRLKTITLITNKKSLDAEKYLKIARLFQTIFRPIYAINKPSMCGLKIVIRIPDRFKNKPVI